MTTLLTNARLLTMAEGRPDGGTVENGAILMRDGRIAFAGPAAECPAAPEAERVDLGGRWVTPALVRVPHQ